MLGDILATMSFQTISPIFANSSYICTVKKQNKVLEKANDEAKTSK